MTTPEEIFRMAKDDPNEWIPPKEAADAAAKAFRQFAVDVPWEAIDWAVMREEGWSRA